MWVRSSTCKGKHISQSHEKLNLERFISFCGQQASMLQMCFWGSAYRWMLPYCIIVLCCTTWHLIWCVGQQMVDRGDACEHAAIVWWQVQLNVTYKNIWYPGWLSWNQHLTRVFRSLMRLVWLLTVCSAADNFASAASLASWSQDSPDSVNLLLIASLSAREASRRELSLVVSFCPAFALSFAAPSSSCTSFKYRICVGWTASTQIKLDIMMMHKLGFQCGTRRVSSCQMHSIVVTYCTGLLARG